LSSVRVVARLDIKGTNLIKGIQLEGLRIVGDPNKFARSYYQSGIDELLYIDSVASLYGRNNLYDIVSKTTEDIFVPVTVGGGIRTIDDIAKLLDAGADKVAINTAGIRCQQLITEAVRIFGSQCIVVSVVAKRIKRDAWEAYVEGGRERTGLDAVVWAKRAADLGAGEILLTSVDNEGGLNGYDIDLLQEVSPNCSVPVIASGGAGGLRDIYQVIDQGYANAVAIASLLHYKKSTVSEIKAYLGKFGVSVRPVVTES
jgi:cyclase